MTTSLILACVWVIAATITALLPMRLQFPPGLSLLVIAPFLIGFIGFEHGVWLALAGFLGFVSMFRRPLIFYAHKWSGRAAVGATQTEDRS
ncbi:DUF2484 family protein [Halocynthiibacter namhaensis]|uniref:DUF2484 family protein n=1 Tax=Halocynthiibacter namhaensis TaxID=1290553 RepID=UPI0005793645|nr:DUF2484 family protein [Halocynthiibacter namhaensis]